MQFNEELTVNTVFGRVLVKYKNAQYTAILLDGAFNGWNAEGKIRATALGELLKQVAERYATDIIMEVEQ